LGYLKIIGEQWKEKTFKMNNKKKIPKSVALSIDKNGASGS
jgi:hypothetical protein